MDEERRAVDTNRATGEIIINFGQSEPVEIPPDTAIKLALLLLKEAGCILKEKSGGFVALYGKAKHRGH